MQFEYDPEKSRKNKEKHGIDFEEAKSLWDEDYISVRRSRDKEKRDYEDTYDKNSESNNG